MTSDLSDADVDFETAVGNPADYYPDPQAIVADATLSKVQKQRFLSEWAVDLTDRQTADGEGMAADDTLTAASDAMLLKQVNAALEQVEGGPDSDPSLTFRTFWARIKQVVG
jgi:hypothetical protein